MLIESGAAEKLGRFELRRGELYRMNAEYAPHTRMKMALIFALKSALAKAGLNFEVAAEGTVRFGDFMPLPDVFLLTAYPSRGPIPGDRVPFVIEVADTTLADDLGSKRDDYAAAALAEYWVVDLSSGIILQHSAPQDGVFTRSETVRRGETAHSLTQADLSIETGSLPWRAD